MSHDRQAWHNGCLLSCSSDEDVKFYHHARGKLAEEWEKPPMGGGMPVRRGSLRPSALRQTACLRG